MASQTWSKIKIQNGQAGVDNHLSWIRKARILGCGGDIWGWTSNSKRKWCLAQSCNTHDTRPYTNDTSQPLHFPVKFSVPRIFHSPI